MKKNEVFIVAGPTASGKTSLAIKLAKKFAREVINADSLQVYKENKILSAQPSVEEKANIPHHLFGYVNGNEEYHVARWLEDVVPKINDINCGSILVGGTGFYLKHLIFGLSSIPDIPMDIRQETRQLFEELGAVNFYKALKDVDPLAASKLDKHNGHKTMRAYEVIKATNRSILEWQQENKIYFPISSFKVIILLPDREKLYENCNQRFLSMLDQGAIDEVQYLMSKNYNMSSGIMKSHGAPELRDYLLETCSLKNSIERSQQVVRNYAKRQITWFKHQFNHVELKKYFVQDSEHQAKEIIEFLES